MSIIGRGEDDFAEERECANCGATEPLAICSRCHSAYFCSAKCQKAYWPFHKAICKRNEFADAIEEVEPRFARWMRKHGKQAQLKDDEVDRLERASKAACGPTRDEVMNSMYNRLNPKPIEPSYTIEEKRKMREKEEQLYLESRSTAGTDKTWMEITIPTNLGLANDQLKWRQDQTFVEIFIRVNANCQPKQVRVLLCKDSIKVTMGETSVLAGELYSNIKASSSHWYIVDGILFISLMKLERRGHFYGKGRSNADTFWRSILKNAAAADAIEAKYPPSEYYITHWELEDGTTGAQLERQHLTPRLGIESA